MEGDPDPRGLIAEAYRLDHPTEAECRSIFLDWVLGLPQGADVPALSTQMLERLGAPDHPMTDVLREATADAVAPRRRGGRNRVSGEARQPPKRAR